MAKKSDKPDLRWRIIRSRTAEGRQRARAKGVKLGRKLVLNAYQIEEAWERRPTGSDYAI